MEKEEFLKLLPKLIREDDEVKGAIITALSGVVSTKEDITRSMERSDRRFEELINQMNEGFKEAREERLEIIKQMNNRFTHVDKQLNTLNVTIGSLGGRSGIALENTILEIMNEELIKENIHSNKINKELLVDKDGIVFTKDYSTDIDILIEDDKTILIDVKYIPDNRDVFHFLRIAELFTKLKKPYDQLIIIALEMKKIHVEYANQQNIKVIAGKIVE